MPGIMRPAALILGLAVLANGCGAPSGPGSPSAAPASKPASAAASAASGMLKISYAQPVAGTAPMWMAHDNGTFKKYGLNTEVIRIAPPADIQAMVGGDTNFAFGGTGAMSAKAGGADLRFVAITTGVFLQTLYSQPVYQKLSDLVGKSVAATTKGGPSDFALHTILKREGLDPAKFNIIYLRDDNAIVTALQSGQIDGAVLTSPNHLRARQAGMRQLVDMVPLKLPTVTQGIFVRNQWAQQNQDTVLNFLKAYLEEVKHDKADAAAATATIRKWTQIDDQAMVEESYRSTLGGLASYPLPRDEQFQAVIDLSSEENLKRLKPADFYDSSYLQKLEGFMKTLYPEGVPGP
jgi:ABC-type nitrate/sulfonate/bicarbonate transport system substrate-binding protein